MKAPVPPNEAERLDALRQYDILDSDPEQDFDDITLLASHVCATPIAMISLVDENRQWFKSKIGMPKSETPRDVAFCAHGILQPEFFEVGDALADERFATNPMVTGNSKIRFYAGAPLLTPDGHTLGMLCVNDQIPRELLPSQKAALQALSRQVVGQLELRKSLKELRRTLADRKIAEEALRESEQKFRQLAENITDVFWITSPDLKKVHYASPAYERVWGRAVADLSAHPQEWLEAILPEDRERVQKTFGKLALGEPSVSLEFRIARPNGDVRWILSRGFRVQDAEGDVVRITGVAKDITEAKRAQEVLKESERRFREMLENVELIAITLDKNGAITFCNDYLLRLTGWKREEVLGTDWCAKFVGPNVAVKKAFFENIEAGQIPTHYENPIKTKSGEIREIAWNNTMLRDTGGNIVGTASLGEDVTERKRAEEILGESERRFRFLSGLGETTRTLSQPKEIMATVARLLGAYLRVSRCAYADVGKDGNHFTVPGDYIDGCASIVGDFQLTDFGRQTHSKMAAGETLVFYDVDAELTPAEGAAAFNAMQIKAMIACPLVKDGRLHAMMAVHHLAPRQWTDGEIALVREVVERCWSIIERARTELVLRESEEHLRLVIASSNDGIFEHDFITGSLTWSDRMYEMLGLDRNSFVPTIDSITPLLHREDRKQFQKSIRELRAHGGRSEAHLRILRQDGSYGNFLSRRTAVVDTAGGVVRSVGCLTDLTSLLKAERKLVEQAELLNLSQDAIIVRDLDDRIEFWNHGAEVLYGWSAEEVQGRLSDDFLKYEDPLKILAERILLETGAWSGECRHLTKQGGTVIVRSRWTLVRDEQGQPKSKLVIMTDLTEQKKVEEQFLRAQRLESIGTLASGVAHDLNNVLVPIMMAAPILRGNIGSAERERFLDIVETSAQRGAAIIKQVLTFARGADGNRILLQPIFLIEEVCKIASQTFPKSIVVRTCYEENIRLLEADSTQLHQILLNLCINARDAMPNGGELCLGVENFDVDEHYASITPGATAGPHVMLEVVDTGSGIPSDVIAKIFDPFFTTKSIGHGTGLGLSTVAGIVKTHGGFIDVSSKPGRTSFKIFLPAKVVVDASIAIRADTIIPQGKGETILLVDDEPSIREVAEVILTSHGYKVLVAEDGPTALAIFARQMGHISVVVTDLAMPGMDGLMLVGTLRRMEPGLKIIVSTGRTDDSHAAEITALGVDGCLTKPYTSRNLLLKLSHVLQGSVPIAPN